MKFLNLLKKNFYKFAYRFFFGMFIVEIIVTRDLNNSENIFMLGAMFLMFDRLK